MFGKKRCNNCKEKVDSDFNFCPYCRANLTDDFDSEDWGLLGRNDSIDNVRVPIGLDKIIGSLMKSLNAQIEEAEKIKRGESKKQGVKRGGISISIVSSGNSPPKIEVKSFGKSLKESKSREKKVKRVKLPSADSSRFIGLPREEPETNVRRLSNRVVYEISLFGVKSINDISISQLESSIEIKALGKEKVYHKVIPVNLPIKIYDFSKGKLILELEAKE